MFNFMANENREKNDEIYSKVIKAGKRTYFFDIKSTKGGDFYLTITESKKTEENGREVYQKHKLFLYKEDFDKFREGFEDVISRIDELKKGEGLKSESESFTFESL